MSKPSVSPASVEATIDRLGMYGDTIHLRDVPSVARMTAKLILDGAAALQARVMQVTVYKVVEIQVPDDVGIDDLPPGVEPGYTTVNEFVAVAQSDGMSPVVVEKGQVVKVGLAVEQLSPNFDRASGALLISGDSWEPISVPVTFKRGSEVISHFSPVELTAQQGGAALTTVTARCVSGPTIDVKYSMVPDFDAYGLKMDPEEVSLRVSPGESKTATLTFRVDRECPVRRKNLRLVQYGGLSREHTISLDVKPAPPPTPTPTQLTLEQASAKIDGYYREHRGHRGLFGFPLGEVQRKEGTYIRNYAGGSIKLQDTTPQGYDRTWVRVRYVGFVCVSESNKASSSEEPYFLIGVAGTNGSNTVRFGPYENVDAGESRFEAAYISNEAHEITPPIVLGVLAMEHDEGTPEEAEAKVRRIMENIEGKFDQLVGAFTGGEVSSHVIPEWARTILIGWVPEIAAALFGMGDDEVGRTPMVLFDNKSDLLEWRSPPIRGRHGPNEYTHVIRVGEDDGPEGQYDLYFKVDLFRTHTTIDPRQRTLMPRRSTSQTGKKVAVP